MTGFPSVGSAYGRYRIQRQLARGGMGAVYEALDTTLQRSVALKVVLPTLSEDGDFRRHSSAVKEHLAAVSGASGGQKCMTYAECLALVAGGSPIHYVGASGIGPLNADRDPSAPDVRIYRYDADNRTVLSGVIRGSS